MSVELLPGLGRRLGLSSIMSMTLTPLEKGCYLLDLLGVESPMLDALYFDRYLRSIATDSPRSRDSSA